jgi:hypothetical protein
MLKQMSGKYGLNVLCGELVESILRRRANNDVADIHVGWLVDGKRDCMGNRVR